MNKLAKIFTYTISTVLVTALLAFFICAGFLIAVRSMFDIGLAPDQRKVVFSPTGKFSAIALTHDGGSLSRDEVEILLKSKVSGQEIGIGYLTGVYNLRIAWPNQNTLSINYESAASAKFGARRLDWDNEIITVQVTPDVLKEK